MCIRRIYSGEAHVSPSAEFIPLYFFPGILAYLIRGAVVSHPARHLFRRRIIRDLQVIACGLRGGTVRFSDGKIEH
jgi:hypothetical protein